MNTNEATKKKIFKTFDLLMLHILEEWNEWMDCLLMGGLCGNGGGREFSVKVVIW